MKFIAKLARKISFFIVFLCILMFCYFSLKKQIKKKLSPEDIIKVTDKADDISKNFHESLFFVNQLLNNNTIENFKILKAESIINKDIFINKAIRIDKVSNYNNNLFCEDEVRFLLKRNKGHFDNENFKEFTVKFGHFDLIGEDFKGIDRVLMQLQEGEQGSFIVINDKKISFFVKLLSIKRNTDFTKEYEYFWHYPKGGLSFVSCFDIINGVIRIYDLDGIKLFENDVRFNLGSGYLPNFIERILLKKNKGDFKFLITEYQINKQKSTFLDNLFRESKNAKILKEKKNIILEIIQN